MVPLRCRVDDAHLFCNQVAIMLNLLSTLPWRKPAPPRVPAALPPSAALPGAPDPAEAPPRGCGWFDSSHELQHGLCVLEHASADAVASELPLSHWLGLHLCGWQGALAN